VLGTCGGCTNPTSLAGFFWVPSLFGVCAFPCTSHYVLSLIHISRPDLSKCVHGRILSVEQVHHLVAQLGNITLAMLHGLFTVSYTHLDVYKRQQVVSLIVIDEEAKFVLPLGLVA